MAGACIHSFITLIGTVSVTEDGDGRLDGVYLPNSNLPCMDEDETDVLEEAARQINEYLAGRRRRFQLPLHYGGSTFRVAVLDEISRIPYGEVRTYAQLAEAVGSPKAFRAVGTVCAENPMPIVIPCHRVVPSSGGVGNYAGGSTLKRWLLDHERGFDD